MKNKNRTYTFWIVAFSMNLLPLVAQGQSGPPADPTPAPAVAPAAVRRASAPRVRHVRRQTRAQAAAARLAAAQARAAAAQLAADRATQAQRAAAQAIVDRENRQVALAQHALDAANASAAAAQSSANAAAANATPPALTAAEVGTIVDTRLNAGLARVEQNLTERMTTLINTNRAPSASETAANTVAGNRLADPTPTTETQTVAPQTQAGVKPQDAARDEELEAQTVLKFQTANQTPAVAPATAPVVQAQPQAQLPALPVARARIRPENPNTENSSDLSLEQLRAIPSLEIRLQGPNNNRQAALVGRIPRDCAALFLIANTDTNPGLSCDGTPTFKVTDLGGLACMDRHRTAGHTCANTSCVSLSEDVEGTVMSMATVADGAPVSIRHRSANQEDSQAQCSPTGLVFRNQAGLAAEARAQRQAAVTAQREQQRAQAQAQASCSPRTLEDIATVRSATEIMRILDPAHYGTEEVRRRNRTLDDMELRLISQEVARANPEKLADLRSMLKTWAEAHADDCSKVAPVYHAIALRYVRYKASRRERDNGSGPESRYEDAADTIEEGLELSCLSERAEFTLEEDERMIEIGKVQALAELGLSNNMMLAPAFTELYQNSMEDVQDSCFGYSASQESCISARNAFTRVQAIPGVAQQKEYTNVIAQQQMAQQMAQMSGQFGGAPGSTLANASMGLGFNTGGGFLRH